MCKVSANATDCLLNQGLISLNINIARELNQHQMLHHHILHANCMPSVKHESVQVNQLVKALNPEQNHNYSSLIDCAQ